MVKRTIILLVLYLFAVLPYQFAGKKNILPRSRSRSEPGVFGPLEPEPLEKKYQEPEPQPKGKKIRSRSRLKKKSRAGAAKKFAGSPALLGTTAERISVVILFYVQFTSLRRKTPLTIVKVDPRYIKDFLFVYNNFRIKIY